MCHEIRGDSSLPPSDIVSLQIAIYRYVLIYMKMESCNKIGFLCYSNLDHTNDMACCDVSFVDSSKNTNKLVLKWFLRNNCNWRFFLTMNIIDWMCNSLLNMSLELSINQAYVMVTLISTSRTKWQNKNTLWVHMTFMSSNNFHELKWFSNNFFKIFFGRCSFSSEALTCIQNINDWSMTNGHITSIFGRTYDTPAIKLIGTNCSSLKHDKMFTEFY